MWLLTALMWTISMLAIGGVLFLFFGWILMAKDGAKALQILAKEYDR